MKVIMAEPASHPTVSFSCKLGPKLLTLLRFRFHSLRRHLLEPVVAISPLSRSDSTPMPTRRLITSLPVWTSKWRSEPSAIMAFAHHRLPARIKEWEQISKQWRWARTTSEYYLCRDPWMISLIHLYFRSYPKNSMFQDCRIYFLVWPILKAGCQTLYFLEWQAPL